MYFVTGCLFQEFLTKIFVQTTFYSDFYTFVLNISVVSMLKTWYLFFQRIFSSLSFSLVFKKILSSNHRVITLLIENSDFRNSLKERIIHVYLSSLIMKKNDPHVVYKLYCNRCRNQTASKKLVWTASTVVMSVEWNWQRYAFLLLVLKLF